MVEAAERSTVTRTGPPAGSTSTYTDNGSRGDGNTREIQNSILYAEVQHQTQRVTKDRQFVTTRVNITVLSMICRTSENLANFVYL